MDDERQSFILTIDNGPLEQQAAQARALLEGIGEGAERGAAEADRAIDTLAEAMQRVPHIKVGVEADVKTLADVRQAFRDIDTIVDQNQAGIKTLEEEYQRLKAVSGEQFMRGADKDYRATEQQCEAIRRVIAERERAIKEARDQAVALQEVEREMQKEAAEADKAAQTHGTLRGRLRELNMALVEMERNGQRGTEAYRRLQLEAADLADRMGDAATQTRILSDDNAGFKGMLSGITGVTGAFTAASGVISMFGSENERLAKIMANVQNLMAITVGLQQVSEMLNKDSAFSLVTLNNLKEWWAKITSTQAVAATAEAAAEGTAATATTANAAAHTGLAAALHAVKTAILTLPFIGWVAAIGTAIAAVVMLTRKTDEQRASEERAKRAKEEHAKAMSRMYDTAADKAADLTQQYRQLQTEWAKLSTEQERRTWIEDNATAFQTLGANVTTVGDAEDFLVKNTDRVVAAFKARAIMVAAQEMQTEAYKKYLREVMAHDNSVAGGGYYKTFKGGEVTQDEAKLAGLRAGVDYNVLHKEVAAGTVGHISYNVFEATKAGIDKINAYRQRTQLETNKKLNEESKKAYDQVVKRTEATAREQAEIISKAGLDFTPRTTPHTPAASTTPKTTPKPAPSGTGGETNEQREARERAERIAAYTEQIKQAQQEAELDIRQQEIDLMEESATKRLAQIDLDYDRALAENRRRREEAKSDDTDTPAEYLQQLDEYDRLAKEQHDAAVAALEEETIQQGQEAMNDYLARYGDYAQRRAVIEQQAQQRIKKIREGTDTEETKAWRIKAEQKQMEADIKALDEQQAEKAVRALVKQTETLRSKTADTLRALKAELQQFAATAKSLTDEQRQAIEDRIKAIDTQLAGRDPYAALTTSLNAYTRAQKETHKAQKEYNKTLKEGSEEEKKAARQKLDRRRQDSQDATERLQNALQGIAREIGSYVDAAAAAADMLNDFGIKLPERLTGFIDGMGKSMKGLESIDLMKPVSIITGTFKFLGGIGSAFGSLFKGGSNAKEVRRTTERLTRSNEALQKSIDSLRDVITSTSGLEALRAGEKAQKEQQAYIDNQLAILNAQMSYYGDHHSNAANFSITGEGLDRARDITGRADLGSGWWDGWSTLSPEAYAAIRREAPDLWQAIISAGKYDKSEFFNAYADLAGSLKDIQEATRQALANMTFDEMKDSFLSALTDMDRSAQDFTNDLAKTLRDGILKARLADYFKQDLEKIYDQAAGLMGDLADNKITEDEYQRRLADIKADYQALIERGRQQTELANKITGYKPDSDATRQAAEKGIAQATQDSVDELNGRMTAVQGHTYEINQNTRLLLSTTADILRSTQAIERNTDRLAAIEQAVCQTDRRLDDIARAGLKIK